MNNPVITQGSITLKKELPIGKLISMLFPDGCMNHVEIDCRHEGEYTVSFKGMRNFDEQAIYPFLVSIERHTLGGEINYIDRDFTLWHHYFEPVKKKWIDQEAFFKYDSSGALISEMLEDCLPLSDNKRAPWGKCEDREIGVYEY